MIGRGRNADLVLNEATISRAHALFGYEGAEVFVQDLGSTNGTLVNGAREHRKPLVHGDELRMGKLVLKVSAATRARREAAPVSNPTDRSPEDVVTLMIVPGQSGSIRRFHVPRVWLRRATLGRCRRSRSRCSCSRSTTCACA